jgi:hypothetical protein
MGSLMFVSNGRSMCALVQSNNVQEAVFIILLVTGNTFELVLHFAPLHCCYLANEFPTRP